jgi:hypothetical protein
MTSQPLIQVFEAMMEKRQIPEERFLSKWKLQYSIKPKMFHISNK